MVNFPIHSTKVPGVTESFNINTPSGRHKYFQAKISKEIEEIKAYLENNTFVAFMLAKKMAGKGTYAKMFQEIIGSKRVETLSVGDIIRDVHSRIESAPDYKKEIVKYMEGNYRGYISPNDAINALLNRSTKKVSIPTEFLLTLIKMEIQKSPKKAFFIDGFPRTLDQISYSLFFREIMNLRDDPDFFILIDICESIIDERMKYRVVCPICKTSRNLKLFPTEIVRYDKKTKEFYLICDNPECKGHGKQRMEPKEGDHLGVEAIRKRLTDDGILIEKALSLHGIPKVLIRNHFPVKDIEKFDKYEITLSYSFSYNKEKQKIERTENPWIIKDDNGIDSHSLLAAPAVVSLVRQIHKILID